MDRRTLEQDGTIGWFERSAYEADQGRFAGAIGANQAENLIALSVKVTLSIATRP